MTREPGGSPGAEAVRHVILSGAARSFGVRMEAILFAAARNDHVEEVIRPALARGEIVLCDRFLDSSRVYQGTTGNLEPDFIETLQRIAIDGVVPELTLIFDIAAERGSPAPESVRMRALRLIGSRKRKSKPTRSGGSLSGYCARRTASLPDRQCRPTGRKGGGGCPVLRRAFA